MLDFRLTGGCYCGNVRYTITAPAVDTHHCHCSICKKIHGAILVTLSIFPRSAFTLEKKEGLSTYNTSSKVHRYFCKSCGGPVTIDLDEQPDLIAVATGTIDHGAHPDHPKDVYRHAFVTSKVPWYEIEDKLLQTEGFQ